MDKRAGPPQDKLSSGECLILSPCLAPGRVTFPVGLLAPFKLSKKKNSSPVGGLQGPLISGDQIGQVAPAGRVEHGASSDQHEGRRAFGVVQLRAQALPVQLQQPLRPLCRQAGPLRTSWAPLTWSNWLKTAGLKYGNPFLLTVERPLLVMTWLLGRGPGRQVV